MDLSLIFFYIKKGIGMKNKKDRIVKEVTLLDSSTNEPIIFKVTEEMMKQYNRLKYLKSMTFERFLWAKYNYGKNKFTKEN